MHTAIPKDELKVFASLKNIRVVFDVGARDDVDYLIMKPGIKLHAFEPNPFSFEELKVNVGQTKNVYLNNFGLGDQEGVHGYFTGTESLLGPAEIQVRVRRMDNYVKEYKIKRIDFLKIDTEGYELPVLRGAGDLKICRYIQYEAGIQGVDLNDDINKLLLANGFTMYYIGGRNVFCVGKDQPMPWIPDPVQEISLTNKDQSNYL